MKEQVIQSFKHLIGYCRSKNKWDVSFEDVVYDKLLNYARDYYGDTWSYQKFDHLLRQRMANFTTGNFGDAEIETVVNDIATILQGTMQDAFIIVPLKGATISSSIVIDKFAIINTTTNTPVFPQKLPINTVVTDIANFTQVDIAKILSALNTFEKSRSSDALLCPLMILKVHGQYDEIATIDYSHFHLKAYSLFLKVIAARSDTKVSLLAHSYMNANHYFCISDKGDGYMHFPLRDVMKVNYELDFLHTAENQNILRSFVSLFEERSYDTLRSTFFRSMKFYYEALNGSEFSLDDVTYQVLNTLIAAETLLVFNSFGEKKSKLAHIMTELLSIPEEKQEEYRAAIIEAYQDRSGLVHSGRQEFGKYIIDVFSQKRDSKALILLNELMAKILTNFPAFYYEIKAKTTPDKYLETWQQKVKAFWPPTPKYTWFQKCLIFIIGLLQKWGKIKG